MMFSRWSEPDKERLFRLVVVMALIFAIVWAGRNFLTSPRPWLDEGIYVQVSRHLVETGHFGLPIEPGKDISLGYVTVGFPVLVPVAIAFSVFSVSLTVARVVAVAFLLLAIASSALLVRRLYGRRAATWTALLVATFPPLFGHGKNLLGEVPGLAYLFVSLLLYDRSPFFFGIVFGLSVASKPTFLPLVVALGLASFIAIRKGETTWRIVGQRFLGVGLMGIVWVWTQFRSEGFVGVLGHYANPYHLENMRHVILTNAVGFITHTTPIHFLALALIVAIGFFLRRIRRLRSVEWILLVFIVLIWASYFRTAGWYRYFFPAHLPLLVLFPAALAMIASRTRLIRPWVISFACLALLSVNIAMLAKDPVPLYGAEWQDVVATVASKGSDVDVMYLTAPEIAVFHPTESFRQYLDITDALHLGTSALERAKTTPPDLLVVGKRTSQIEPLLAGFTSEREYSHYSIWTRKEKK